MTQTMYDAAVADGIPTDAALVAGYDDGRLYKWSAADWARFPNAKLIHITATGETLTSHVADLEQGDIWPAGPGAKDWLQRRLDAGITTATNIPTLYCSITSLPEVQQYCQGFSYQLWIANPTGVAHLYPGSMATQYSWQGGYDLSLVEDNWSPIAAAPTPDPQPTVDPLIGALAYVCDTLGDEVLHVVDQPLSVTAQNLKSIQAEMQRVRVQFLGARP